MSGLRQVMELLRDLLTWWVTVTPWEQAIRVRAGKHVLLLGPGWHLRIPVVDRVYRQSIRRRAATLSSQTLTTMDGRTLTVAAVLGYRIADLLRLYETLHHAQGTLDATVQGAVGRYVTTHKAADCEPALLVEGIPALCGLERYGIADVEVSLTTFAYVRTFRFITGEGSAWGHGGDLLNTSREDNEPQNT